MKKFFARDKQPRMAKVTPAARDLVSPGSIGDLDTEFTPAQYQQQPHPGYRPPQPSYPTRQSSKHERDREYDPHAHAYAQSAPHPNGLLARRSSDERWEVVAPEHPTYTREASPLPNPHAHLDLSQPQPLRAPPLSTTSSLTSLPPAPLTPGVQSPGPETGPGPRPGPPRSSSPYSTSSQHYPRSQRSSQPEERDRTPSSGGTHGPSRKKAGPPAAAAALGILRALDPHAAPPVPVHQQPSPPDQYWDDYDAGSEAHLPEERERKKEKKDRRPFWQRDRSKERDKEKEKERQKEMEREREREKGKGRDRHADEEDQAEITRMIGYLTATASEDWSLVLEVCERAAATEANAKEATKALRREFKYAEPAAQLSAARLWAIMLNNASEAFFVQSGSRKFLDTLEDVLSSNRTSPVVRERLLEVLAGATYASIMRRTDGRKHDKDGFQALWRKVKSPDKPDQGIPFDTTDAMFCPPTPRRQSSYFPPAPPVQMQPVRTSKSRPSTADALRPKATQTSSSRTIQTHGAGAGLQAQLSPVANVNRVIPLDEDIRRLFQECKVGRGNAALLADALTFAKPEDLGRKEVIKEFMQKCRMSQEFIYAQIPWASTGAERSRQLQSPVGVVGAGGDDPAHLGPNGRDGDSPPVQTIEEQLLAELLGANEELLEALRTYDDLERVGVEREAEERSRREVRLDRSRVQYQDADGALYLEPPPGASGGGSSSRSSTPSSPSSSPAPAAPLPPVVPSHAHPLPPIPTQGQGQARAHPTLPQPHALQAGQGQGQAPLSAGLAPPARAARGPRSPAVASVRSRSPSLERSSTGHHSHSGSHGGSGPTSVSISPQSSVGSAANGLRRLDVSGHRRQWSEREEEGRAGAGGAGRAGEEDVRTPVKPSAKALGKRRAAEAEDPEDRFDPDEMFHEHTDDLRGSGAGDEGADSDSDAGGARGGAPWHQPVRYAYDAVQERYQQHVLEGKAGGPVNGVH